MKNPKTILQHLYSNHPKFWQSRCFRKILSLLPPRFQQQILYIYLKNKTLYFVFSHPAFAMEFNYNKKVINEVLKLAKQNIHECKGLEFTHYKAYNKFIPTKQEEPTPSQCYCEKAKGNFTIYTTNEALAKIFIKIKEQIQKNGTPAND